MAGHGGAWKVAFADFMTALMALFLVLWISSQDKEILIATSQYFQNPFTAPLIDHSGVMPFNSNKSTKSTGTQQGNEKQLEKAKQIELTFLNSVAADFYRMLHLDQNLAEKPIDVQVTTDGLRVTLFDRAQQPLFAENTTELTEWGRYMMQSLAWMIDRHHFHVTIDGHTRGEIVGSKADYTAWELSADRANAARRLLVHYAVEAEYIERVTGYAATRPLPGEKPGAKSNDRITLSLTLSASPKDRPSAVLPSVLPAPAPISPGLIRKNPSP
ncbi:MAG: flagellar motor protein MotB [Opitutae bacterium]